ncbi:Uncharacterized protein Fot_50211 [Forsythia ovata]|uniref:Uncharacterized protein n=1 Tax=Forsythia ovata TaxID=205694 RepID=A0ABD1PXH0_9LAMI
MAEENGDREFSLMKAFGLFLIYIVGCGILLCLAIYTCKEPIEHRSFYSSDERDDFHELAFVLFTMFAFVLLSPICIFIIECRSKKKNHSCQVFPEVEADELRE